ncbi:hypothetical protein PAECIP111893_03504 [Paenibacillus plantiphilus]|uniref:ABC-2 type transport system permease protein n=1 Tax=Paenibacillus plantiphilus TaxID=2905650 RepID=A0ABN8GLT9_9BACL|nr:hypothetical protein [Paenibacillus plantiphilus]CAH1212226.1 hypothetical protein PAECIP111893_03504 [Paenibacillus plantiphilus]
MLLFELYYRRQSRWLVVYSLITIHFLLMGLMSSGLASIWQFVISIFTQPLAAIVIFPILFIIMFADLVSANDSDRFTDYTLTRFKSRVAWFLSKIGVLAVSAFLFTAISIAIALLLAICIGFPMESISSEHSLVGKQSMPLSDLLMIIVVYTCTLAAFGTFVIMISLFTRSARAAGWIGAIMSLIGYGCWMEESLRTYLKWTPTSQMLVSQLADSNRGSLLTIQWSFTYNSFLFVLSLLVCISIIRKVDLSKSV